MDIDVKLKQPQPVKKIILKLTPGEFRALAANWLYCDPPNNTGLDELLLDHGYQGTSGSIGCLGEELRTVLNKHFKK